MSLSRRVPVLLALVCLALAIALPASGQSGITVTGADSVRSTGLVTSSELEIIAESAPPRVIAEYASSTARHAVASPPGPLQALVSAVHPRVLAEYARSTAPRALAAPPSGLLTVLSLVTDRALAEYANSTLPSVLVYPRELLGDNTPPQITAIQATKLSDDTMIVRWATDEYADSEVVYGNQSGVYSGTASDSLYVKQHDLTITGLPSEVTIYLCVRSTDQSGNTAQSAELTHTPEEEVYLPLVLRNW